MSPEARERRRLYRQTPEYREKARQYRQSPAGKAAHDKYKNSARGQEKYAEYLQSDACKASRKRWNASPQSKDAMRVWRESPEGQKKALAWRTSERGKRSQREKAKRYRGTEHGKRVMRALQAQRSARTRDPQGNAAYVALGEKTTLCIWCGKRIEPQDIQIDHVIPLCRGGAHSDDNFAPSCVRCNLQKKDKMPLAFLVWRKAQYA